MYIITNSYAKLNAIRGYNIINSSFICSSHSWTHQYNSISIARHFNTLNYCKQLTKNSYECEYHDLNIKLTLIIKQHHLNQCFQNQTSQFDYNLVVTPVRFTARIINALELVWPKKVFGWIEWVLGWTKVNFWLNWKLFFIYKNYELFLCSFFCELMFIFKTLDVCLCLELICELVLTQILVGIWDIKYFRITIILNLEYWLIKLC